MEDFIFDIQRFANISNSANITLISGTSDADSISNSGSIVTIDAGAGNDTVSNATNTDNVVIYGGDGDDSISNGYIYYTYSSYAIPGGYVGPGASAAYPNTIRGGNNVVIYGGNGNDTIRDYGYGSSTVDAGGVTISGGAGNDYVQVGGYRPHVFVYESGNDTIGVYNNDTLNFAATYTGWQIDYSRSGTNYTVTDLMINAVEGSIRFTSPQGKWINLADANGNFLSGLHLASSSEAIVDGRARAGYEVIAGYDGVNNQIFAGTGGSSLWGGNNSNDDLYGNVGYDEFVYFYGNGQDNIFQASAEDVVNINTIAFEQVSGAQILDTGVSLQFTDGGTLNVSGQAGTFILGGQSFGADYQTKTWYVK